MLPERLEQRLKEILAQVEDLREAARGPRGRPGPRGVETPAAGARAPRSDRAPVPRVPPARGRPRRGPGDPRRPGRGRGDAPPRRGTAAEAERERERLVEEIKQSLVAEDEDDRRDAIVEIRAGTGGDEAALFAGDLFRMYAQYRRAPRLEGRGRSTPAARTSGGSRRSASPCAGDAFPRLRFESGVHRVQRVPETEAQGRIHTSTATVAVLPEAEDVDVEIKDPDDRDPHACAPAAPAART